MRRGALLVLAFALACSKSDDAAAPAAPDDAGRAPIDASPSGNDDAGSDGGSDDENEGTFDEGTDDAGANLELDAMAGEGGCNQADIESNDTLATARPLAATTDCDGNGNKIRGTISGAGDVDYFHFHGKDTFTCEVNPSAAIDVAGVHLCMYAKCDNPGGSMTCSSGVSDNAGGCCVDGPGTVDTKVDCPGTDDSSTIYLKASAVGSPTCKTYTITYHY